MLGLVLKGRANVRYTDELKMLVMGDYLTGVCPTQNALHEKHGVSRKTLRKWVHDTDLIEAWARQHDGPMPALYEKLTQKAVDRSPEMWDLDAAMPDWPKWGRAFAEMAADFLPASATRLINPTKIAVMLQSFAIGAPAWSCWRIIGVPEAKVVEWRQKAEKDEEPYVSLFSTIEAAKAFGVVAKTGAMLDCPKEYKAAAWILAHRHRKDFHTQQVIETKGESRPLEGMPDDQLEALVKLEE